MLNLISLDLIFITQQDKNLFVVYFSLTDTKSAIYNCLVQPSIVVLKEDNTVIDQPKSGT